MGCSCTKNSSSDKLKIHLQSKLANLTRSRSNLTETFSRQSSIRSPRCLNIKIVSESSPALENSLNLSGTPFYLPSLDYIPYYTFLKKAYSSFMSSKRFFFNQVHETCFTDFEIKDGLSIMLISLYGNGQINVKFSESFPFLHIKGEVHEETKEILSAWTIYIEEIQKILKNNSKKIKKAITKMQEFSSELEKFSNNTIRQDLVKKSIKYCKFAEALGKEVLSEALNTYESIYLFFKRIQKFSFELKNFGAMAGELSSFSGERIVHEIVINSF